MLARASSAAPVERAVTYTIDEEGEYWDWRWGSRIHFVRCATIEERCCAQDTPGVLSLPA